MNAPTYEDAKEIWPDYPWSYRHGWLNGFAKRARIFDDAFPGYAAAAYHAGYDAGTKARKERQG